MSKCIKNENGIYVELPRDKIKFESKEAELIFDLSLENDELQQENKQLKDRINKVIKLLQENVDWGEDMNSQQAIKILKEDNKEKVDDN